MRKNKKNRPGDLPAAFQEVWWPLLEAVLSQGVSRLVLPSPTGPGGIASAPSLFPPRTSIENMMQLQIKMSKHVLVRCSFIGQILWVQNSSIPSESMLELTIGAPEIDLWKCSAYIHVTNTCIFPLLAMNMVFALKPYTNAVCKISLSYMVAAVGFVPQNLPLCILKRATMTQYSKIQSPFDLPEPICTCWQFKTMKIHGQHGGPFYRRRMEKDKIVHWELEVH